jgi:glucose/arabinose dehydrogenase
MARIAVRLAATGLLVAGVASPATAQLASDLVAVGLRAPVAVAPLPGEPRTFLVVEQDGIVRVVGEQGVANAPFLDLRADVGTGGERGLLGIALAPDYVESGRLYVNFTNRSGDTVIARFRRSEEDPLRADPRSRFDLLWPDLRRTIAQPFSNHNGGHLAFGPDGYLYVGLGDGGSAGDPMNLAQNPQSLLGKMLRLDVGVPDDDVRGYRVPEDNPFTEPDTIRALPEIWALGLRNPWRYSFDDPTRGGTSALTIGDVGQNAREEINFAPRGAGGRNYGWRIREGRQAYDARTAPAILPLRDPIHDYGRALGASVTGGYVYRGAALDPSFHGRYFFADFVSGRVFSLGLHLDATGEATADDEREHTAALGGRDRLGMVSSFGTDHDGELLLLNYSAGRLLRLVPDLAVVPQAPVLRDILIGADTINIVWEPATGGVVAEAYAVERLRHGAVVERSAAADTSATLPRVGGDCLRVRGQARDGRFGPPSASHCEPLPPD